VGGTESSSLSYINRFQFPFNSGTANIIGNLSANYGKGVGANNCSIYGYVCGGASSIIDRFQFPFNSWYS